MTHIETARHVHYWVCDGPDCDVIMDSDSRTIYYWAGESEPTQHFCSIGCKNRGAKKL